VNCIAPGRIENDWSSTLPEASRQEAIAFRPYEALGNATGYSEHSPFPGFAAASFITGQVIIVMVARLCVSEYGL